MKMKERVPRSPLDPPLQLTCLGLKSDFHQINGTCRNGLHCTCKSSREKHGCVGRRLTLARTGVWVPLPQQVAIHTKKYAIQDSNRAKWKCHAFKKSTNLENQEFRCAKKRSRGFSVSWKCYFFRKHLRAISEMLYPLSIMY